MQLLFNKKTVQKNTKSNPKITFFKSVVKKYHNFAMEPIELHFSYVNLQRYSESIISCQLPKYAPIVQNITFQINIPRLKQLLIRDGESFECKWKSPIGFYLIKKAELLIGRDVVDTISGEWIYLYSKLYATDEERVAFEKLLTTEIGNINVPLPFWFSRDRKQVLPIQNLTYDSASVRLTLRAIEDCYVIRKLIS